MAVDDNALIIGITGSFGSGCSTLSEALKDGGYEHVSLSDYIHEKWLDNHPGEQVSNATREELQDIGNELRHVNGNWFLAERAFNQVTAKPQKYNLIVIDSIRHPEEAAFFRRECSNFYLIAVDASLDQRWQRLRTRYESKGLTLSQFKYEDARDAYEDIDNGQKVQLCVDDADIAVSNDEHYDPRHAQKSKLLDRVEPYIKLISGKDLRSPSPRESMMALAYSIALRSSCYKRQVGAVIADENDMVLATECNENPPLLGSCSDTYGECYRDIYKRQVLKDIENIEDCPKCQEKLKGNISGDLKCTKCGCDLDKYFIRDRALSRCTALHAEERAIINAKSTLEGCTIYTTTFPCFLCAQKIIASGIRTVIYCESYPDMDSEKLFDKISSQGHHINVEKFEGVKARAYFHLFTSWRSQIEESIRKKRGIK